MPSGVRGGQEALGRGYLRDGGGIHRAYGLGVLTVTAAGIAVFGGGPGLVAAFGLPAVHPGVPNYTTDRSLI
ncbi:hypothetical protein [Nonomuraea sp. SYSU D8015]|uniref:hypothetical protein n=1 Tax=Nonomuraea sp. SYSU D8015 TaxID=2593644 RepID=UPI001660D251|nr:hypothetical protein [Nonomuraea sp. SYSU D8015]